MPLLELDDGTLVTESTPIVRRIFTEAQMLAPSDAPAVDAFVSAWTSEVEPAYYDVLRAGSEPQARFAMVGLLEALARVEERLFASRMSDTG